MGRMRNTRTLSIVGLALLVLSSPANGQRRLDDGLKELADQVASRTSDNQMRRVAVVPFRELDGRETVLGSYLAESLTTRLFNVPGLRVVERSMLDKVMAELKLASSGVIDPSTAARIGKLLGVEAIVTGSLTDLQSSVAINCRMIDVSTGEVYGAAEVRIVKDDDLQILNRSAPGEMGAGYADARVVASKDFDYLRVTLRTVEFVAPSGGRTAGRSIRLVWEFQNREGQRSVLLALNGEPHQPGGRTEQFAPPLRASLLDDQGGGWGLSAGAVSGLGYVRAGVYGQHGGQVYSPADIARLLQLRDRLGRDDNDPSDGSRQRPAGWVTPYGAPPQSFYPFEGNRFISGTMTTVGPGRTVVVTTEFALGRGTSGEPGSLQVNLEVVSGLAEPGGRPNYSLRNVVFDKVLLPRK